MHGVPRRLGTRARTRGIGMDGWCDIQRGQEFRLFGGWAGYSAADVGWLNCVRAGRIGRGGMSGVGRGVEEIRETWVRGVGREWVAWLMGEVRGGKKRSMMSSGRVFRLR